MKLTTTSILTLLPHLAACICKDTEVGIGYINYDNKADRKGALIANDCNVINHTNKDNYCYGWGETYQVHCDEDHRNAQSVTIKKQGRIDEYQCGDYVTGEQCDGGVVVGKCCALV
ncbi:hypothetical protein P168DRAFT_287665 [Aspergillus campestris IBT 28561]|uniref:Cyanovirin-N domain-containing protein n=1 Tax=Aspergillus campestris (strain IBT 28561) TaxID=1392248 RepID=A0A2I1DBD2_ASPC2|nr:uncharacterized protein P168DRAFT_287665 [Aspergillus campestris IBT 28561]PKY07171.1 hypothetical protein P168DRAFT_287665 [Aspergillus campestris IBT 28561]